MTLVLISSPITDRLGQKFTQEFRNLKEKIFPDSVLAAIEIMTAGIIKPEDCVKPKLDLSLILFSHGIELNLLH